MGKGWQIPTFFYKNFGKVKFSEWTDPARKYDLLNSPHFPSKTFPLYNTETVVCINCGPVLHCMCFGVGNSCISLKDGCLCAWLVNNYLQYITNNCQNMNKLIRDEALNVTD